MDTSSEGEADGSVGFQFSEENVQRLKQKYMEEMKREAGNDAEKPPGSSNRDQENPMRACMRIMFEAASERDPAKRAELACQLSKLLVRPDGLINLFLALIDFDTSSQKTTTHNQRFMAVAKIIAHLPKLALPYVEYCDNLRAQLRLILVHHETKYSSLASMILKALLESPHAAKEPQQVRQVLIDPFIRPLSEEGQVDCSLKLQHSILAIHNLIQNHMPTKLFVETFPYLFYALVTLDPTPSPLKIYLRSSLSSILNGLKPGAACCLLEQTLFFHENKCNIYQIVTDDDQVSLEISERTGETSDFKTVKQVGMSILENCDNELLVLEFFFHFQAKMWTTTNADERTSCASLIEPLLEQTVEEKPTNKLDLLTSIISNGQRALELISRTLLNYLDFLKQFEHEDGKQFDELQKLINPPLNNCLDILEVLFTTIENLTVVKRVQGKIVATLREIKSLVTRDGLKCDERLEQNLSSLIEKLSQAPDTFEIPKSSSMASREYDEAMRDLNDPLVPVRVHALVRLKNLILTGDQHALARIMQLYSMIECSFADPEPYVFLASINLMAEMGMRKTADLLPKLVDLYAKQELDVQHRLNTGEVLVRLARRLNATAPFYAQQIIGTFLASTRDHEELVRMSSLSNIGELCRNLGDSLGKYIVEVLHCVERILDADTVQVKCAAIELLRLTLMELNALTMESIQRELKTIYSLLKKTRQKTLDDKLCLQVDLALDEIDRLAREMLGSGRSDDGLTKNIKMLSLLD